MVAKKTWPCRLVKTICPLFDMSDDPLGVGIVCRLLVEEID